MLAADTGRRHRRWLSVPEATGTSGVTRVIWLLVAMLALVAAAGVTAAQPYAPWWPVIAGLPLFLLACWRPAWGAAVAMGLLPVADFTDHTGMIFLAESDFLLLAAIAGGALRFGLKPLPFTDIGRRNRRGPLFDRIVEFVNAYREKPTAMSQRVFISCGVYESLIYENRSLVPLLDSTGMQVRFVEARDGHNWQNWRDRLREGLSWLFPGPLMFVYE